MPGPANLSELKAAFRERGWYARPTLRVLAELTWHVTTFLIGLTVMSCSNSLWVSAGGLFLVTLGLLGVGTNTHTSAHYATSDRRWLNEFLTYFGYPFFLQVSATYWWNKHNDRHHPNANVHELDPDADILPWFALTDRSIKDGGKFRRWYFRHQWLFFPVLLAFNSFSIQFTGWQHLLSCLRHSESRKRAHWIDLGALSMHWLIWIILPCFFFSVQSVVMFNVLRALTMSYALFAVLGLGHYPSEAVVLTRRQRTELDFVGRQTITTVNFRTRFYGRLLCSGLEFHIEHHLFPTMCHVYYPRASVLIQEYCAEHGYPYRSFSWPETFWKAMLNFRNPKPHQTMIEPFGVLEREEEEDPLQEELALTKS